LEDLTHVKAVPKNETLKIEEVQSAMTDNVIKTKDQWLTPELMQKLLAKPQLLAALQDP
jgi:hypothetical protein